MRGMKYSRHSCGTFSSSYHP